MSKEEFKKRWKADDCDITFDEVAECAIEWGVCKNPRIRDIDEVLNDVLRVAGVSM